MARLFFAALLLNTVVPVIAQNDALPTRVVPQRFEVVSIRPLQSQGNSRRLASIPGGGFVATNAPLRLLIARAYNIGETQISGGPGWIGTETFDITAKANTPLELTRDELRPLLQAMLAERFHLTVHEEIKDGPVYSLTVAKSGAKLKAHEGPGSPSISLSSDENGAVLEGSNVSMARLAEHLSGRAGRPVVDNTNLQGEYDLRVQWTTASATDASGPSVFTAIQEQLGLKLEPAKLPVKTILVDRVEQPTQN